MGIGKHQAPRSLHGVSLLIGSGGDLSLMSAIIQAPHKLGDPIAHSSKQDRDTDWVWVSTFEDAQRLASSAQLKLAVADATISSAHAHIRDVRGRSIPIRAASDELERMLGRASVQHGSHGSDLPGVDNSPSRAYLVTKRLIDIALGSIVLALVAIPIILLYLYFCLSFGRSSFLKNRELVGKNGHPFTFRQLDFVPTRLVSDSRRIRYAKSVNNALGHLHLRVAPALLSVIVGDMSLVGPRPEDEATNKRGTELSGAYVQRFLVHPGLVSLARVRFPYTDSPRDIRLALEYDLFYVKHRSHQLDARILGRAVLILARDAWNTISLSAGILGRMMVNGIVGLFGRDSVRPSRIASVAMPTDDSGAPLELKPALIVGAGIGGRLIVNELQRDRRSGLWPVAFVDDDPALLGTRIRDLPVLGNTGALQAVVDREHIETIILAMPSASELDLQRIADIARDTGVPLLTMPSVGSILTGDDATRLRTVPTSDLLGRPVVETDAQRAREFLGGKRVLVTGAAGSIGCEVVRQALRGEPDVIYGLDINESDLYDLQQELKAGASKTRFIPIVASVTQATRITKIMEDIRPHVIFHAAAYKHVPLMEDFPHEAIQSNILGTYHVAHAAAAIEAGRFVLVSTDKAVRPSSVMGASKRIAELVVRDVAAITGLSACAVRFGNVLGSRGSVIPLFEKQIAAGGPITITDKRMTRYFMTIPEAAGLIIEAGAFGDSGVIYMLDMGEPVKIVDVADRLIRLHGKRPGTDIEITYSGLRPGEKLFEELSLDFEAARETGHSKIRILDQGSIAERQPAELMMRRLLKVIQNGAPSEIRTLIMRNVAEADGVDMSLANGKVTTKKTETA